VLAHKNVFDPVVLRSIVDGDEPLTAAVAGLLLSHLAERDGHLEDAFAAAQRFLGGFGDPATPWLWLMAHERVGTLAMRVGRTAEARDHFAAAVRLLDVIGARRDVIGVYWGMTFASLHLGELDDAEHWLARATADNAGSPAEAEEYAAYNTSTSMFVLATRAQLTLARDDVDGGLVLWRRAATMDDEPGTQPWTLEIQAGAVSAHARFGRLDAVADLVAHLPVHLERLLTNPVDRPPVYMAEFPLAGALLFALGMADIATGADATGVRLVALAPRFQYLQGLQPALPAEVTGRAVYTDAVAEYAGLDRPDLRETALSLLATRPDRG